MAARFRYRGEIRVETNRSAFESQLRAMIAARRNVQDTEPFELCGFQADRH
jgi:hypothetical protein